MIDEKTTALIQKLEGEIQKLENKEFNVFFYVVDTKGNASGVLEYIYQTANNLYALGYKVTMLYNETEDFVGVSEWFGEKYGNLPHKNVAKENFEVSPADFLIIPEVYASVMKQTEKLPCKRIALVQNVNYLPEFLPIGGSFANMNIYDAITNTEAQANILHSYFPSLKVNVVRPAIQNKFRKLDGLKKFKINIVARDSMDVRRIIQPFYWQNPYFKWVSFEDLRGMSQSTFAESLRNGIATIWIDEPTNFGYSALEAARCGNVVFAKVPERLSDWMVEDGELTDSLVWFDSMEALPGMIASLVESYLSDTIPADIYEAADKLSNLYKPEMMAEDMKKVYIDGYFGDRLESFKTMLSKLKNNVDEEKSE